MSTPAATVPAPKPRKRRFRRFLVNLAVLAASGLVAVLVAEGMIRLVAPQQLILIRPELWQPADTVGWMHRPNASVRINTGERTVTVNTDAMGYRVGKDGRRDAPVRILLLGDSFMEALQVDHEQHFAHLLERELGTRLGKAVVVRNAGIVGWDPNHYLLRGRQLLARDTFDLVISAVFVGNDAVTERVDVVPRRSPAERKHFRVPRGLSWRELIGAFLAPGNDWLEEHSHLFILLKNQLQVVRMRMGLTAQYMPPQYLRSEEKAARWRITAELSRDLASAAAAKGVPTLFVLIPESFQVYESVFRDYVAGFGIDTATLDLNQPNRLLGAEFTAAGLRFVDVLPEFRAQAGAQRLYGSVDTHFAPPAHELLAKLVAPRAESLLVKPAPARAARRPVSGARR